MRIFMDWGGNLGKIGGLNSAKFDKCRLVRKRVIILVRSVTAQKSAQPVMASKLTELRRINLGPTRFNVSLVIVAGSILDYEGDAFVNAANEGCTGGFGVDEQVNKAGGFELKEARKQFGGCQTGQCKVIKNPAAVLADPPQRFLEAMTTKKSSTSSMLLDLSTD